MPDRAWNESKTAKKEKNMTKMDKEYIEKEYEQAILPVFLDFRTVFLKT